MTASTAFAGGRDPLDIPRQYNLVADLVDRHVLGGRAGHVAIEYQGRSWTYGDVADQVNRVGHGLRALGVAREQRVLLVVPDSPEFVATYLGAMKIGAVAVPCNTFLGTPEYAYFLRVSRAVVLVTTSEHFRKIEPILADAPDLRTVVLTDAEADSADGRVRSWATWIAGMPATLDPVDTGKDDPAFWLWTSGSTGEPKAAVHLHQDWPWCCHLYAQQTIGMAETDKTFSAAKLFHAYGLGNGLVFPFWVGGRTVLMPDRATPDAVYGTLARAHPTIFFGVPTLYAAMLAVPDAAAKYDLSSLRFCVSAGEALPEDLFRRWHEQFGTAVLDGIGSTEVLHIYVSPRLGDVRPGSTGKAVPGYEVKVIGDDGTPLGPNRIGDLIVKGPSTATMYWNRRNETAKKMRGEWFFTGDKYYYDADGYLWYGGRSDDMFKVGGEWLSPVEVEAATIAHAAVLECAVVPYRDEAGVLRPKAVVVLKDGRTGDAALAAELQAFIRTRIAHYKCPRVVEFVGELPKTAAGKIQRFKLRD